MTFHMLSGKSKGVGVKVLLPGMALLAIVSAAADASRCPLPPRMSRRKQEGQVSLQQSYMVLVQVRVRRLRG